MKFAVFLALFLLSETVLADPRFGDLFHECDTAVIGRVESKELIWINWTTGEEFDHDPEFSSYPYTKIYFAEERVAPGFDGPIVNIVYLFGGQLPDGSLVSRSDYPELHIGNEYLVFLRKREVGNGYRPCGREQVQTLDSVFILLESSDDPLLVPYRIRFRPDLTASKRKNLTFESKVIESSSENLIPLSLLESSFNEGF